MGIFDRFIHAEARLSAPFDEAAKEKAKAEIIDAVNEVIGQREANLVAKEQRQSEAREVLLHARDYTCGVLADNGSPETAAAFRAEFNRRIRGPE